jgi:glycosyltransferase involved in cell wall biosynthesis
MNNISPIIFITDGLYPNVIGGMQMHSYRLVSEWLKQGKYIELIYPSVSADQLSDVFQEYLKNGQLNIIDIPASINRNFPWSYLWNEVKYAWKVSRIVSTLPAGPIYTQGLTGLFIGAKLKKRHGKHVTNPHGLEPFQLFFSKKPAAILYRFLFKIIFNRASYVVSLGGQLSQLLIDNGVPPKKIAVLANGITTSWLLTNIPRKPTNEQVKWLFVGRNETRKGLQDLIVVFKQINNIKVTLCVVGPLSEAEKVPVQGIDYLGPIYSEAQLKKVYDTHDVLICPSKAEGMPTVILEAMSRGLAVVATNVGATEELVDEKNGCLIEPHNIAVLTASLKQVAEWDLATLLLKKECSLQKIKQFTWPIIAEETAKKMEEESCV